MARSSRGSKKSKSRSKRMPLDWVVNDYTYNNIFQPLDNTDIAGFPLTFPRFILAEETFPGGVALGGYAYPEQSKGQVAVAVAGSVVAVPTTWALGSFYDCMLRIVKKPMDYAGGVGAITDPLYSLYDAQYANERFVWQMHIHNRFELGSAHEMVRIHWSGKVYLEPDEALYIFAENLTGVTSRINFNFKLRTLMRADE